MARKRALIFIIVDVRLVLTYRMKPKVAFCPDLPQSNLVLQTLSVIF